MLSLDKTVTEIANKLAKMIGKKCTKNNVARSGDFLVFN